MTERELLIDCACRERSRTAPSASYWIRIIDPETPPPPAPSSYP